MNRIIRKNTVSRKKKEAIRESEVNKITRYVKAKGLTKAEINKIKESLNTFTEAFDYDNFLQIYGGFQKGVEHNIRTFQNNMPSNDETLLTLCDDLRTTLDRMETHIMSTY